MALEATEPGVCDRNPAPCLTGAEGGLRHGIWMSLALAGWLARRNGIGGDYIPKIGSSSIPRRLH
jgi:hypothetical protein